MIKHGQLLVRLLVGLLIGGAALAVYAFTLSPGAVPGESAVLIVQNAGLVPRMMPSHPIFSSLSWLVSQIPFGGLAIKLNLFSAVCGALSVVLLYLIMARVVALVIDLDTVEERIVRIAGHIGGAVSAAAFAFSVPFWIVSNRAHTASFDILLLLSAAWLFVSYAASGRQYIAIVLSLLYGLGCVESAAFIVFAPLVGLSFIYVSLSKGQLRLSFVLKLCVAAVAGLSMYLVAAYFFLGTVGYQICGFNGYLDVLLVSLRQQYGEINGSLPREGWLIVQIMTTIPWLTCLAVGRRGLNGEKDWGFYLLHVVITAICVAVLLNTTLSPWRITGKLMVTSYLLASSCLGYIAAYWFMQPNWRLRGGEGPLAARIGFFVGVGTCLPFAVLVIVVPFMNLRAADGRPAGVVNSYAREIVDSMEGRKWLLTDGGLDELLLIAAKDAGQPFVPLNVYGSGNPAYLKFVSALFEEPRLKNMAAIGMFPLVQEWLASDPAASKQIAALSFPDLLAGTGMTVVPNKLVFFGVKTNEPLDTAAMMAGHQEFWNRWVPHFNKAAMDKTADPRGAAAAGAILQQIAVVANNLGVLMQDLGDDSNAFTAYSKAHETDTNNVSSVLNLIAMLDSGYKVDHAETTKEELARAISSPEVKNHIWELARSCGYVRSVEGFERAGVKWSQAGQFELAAASLSRAEKLLPEAQKARLQAAAASLSLSMGKVERGRTIYEEMLKKEPGNQLALMGLVKIALTSGEFTRAAELLSEADAAGVDKSQIQLERAALAMSTGNRALARGVLQQLVERDPKSLRAWSMLADVMVMEEDQVALDKCLKQLAKLDGGRTIAAVMTAKVALRKGDKIRARRSLEDGLMLLPKNVYVIEQLLRLDFMERNAASLLSHARSILLINPNHAFANYAIGFLHVAGGEKDLAEGSFRRSLEAGRMPEALNDLAWLLQERGDYVQAEQLVREALATGAGMSEAWDTLGVILMKTAKSDPARLSEAEQAFNSALTGSKDAPGIVIHMAALQAEKGEREKAIVLLKTLSSKRGILSQVNLKEMDSLAARLGTK